VYLAIIAGDNVEEGLAHFRRKAEEADPQTVGTYPAEVLVNLLLRLERPKEALAIARKHLVRADESRLSAPASWTCASAPATTPPSPTPPASRETPCIFWQD